MGETIGKFDGCSFGILDDDSSLFYIRNDDAVLERESCDTIIIRPFNTLSGGRVQHEDSFPLPTDGDDKRRRR
jgi:hypothetical protein